MLNSRQEHILAAVVREYVETAQPVSSKILTEKYGLNVSPATVRSDMVLLEEAGYLRQPHTSAGRIPTEEGYRYYLEKFVRAKGAPRVRVQLTITAARPPVFRDFLQQVAKSLVKHSGETAFVSQEDGYRYYTGLSMLFQKPDFNDVEQMRALGQVVDRFDELVRSIAPRLDNNVNVWIGGENPFGAGLATVLVRFHHPGNRMGVLGLVGPQRMDYARNMKLLADAREVIQSRV